MKSLQLLTPSKPCIYNCPFCISKSHEHHNEFPNLYEENHEEWVRNYIEVLMTNPDLSYVVITGTNEPMQSRKCISEMTFLTHLYRPDIQVELQTRYYNPSPEFKEVDLVAYSISDSKLLSKIEPYGRKNRFVLILTDTYENMRLEDILKEIPKQVKEVTFKVLHNSNGINLKMDNWIKEHELSDRWKEILNYDVSEYEGPLSIRYDATCLDATNRYMIFREDGILYKDWNEKVKTKKRGNV